MLRPVDNMDDTVEFPPVTVHETHVRSRTVADYAWYFVASLLGIWAMSCMTMVLIILTMV